MPNTSDLKELVPENLELHRLFDKYAQYAYREIVHTELGYVFYNELKVLLIERAEKEGTFEMLLYPYINAYYTGEYARHIKENLLRAVNRIYKARERLGVELEDIVEALIAAFIHEPVTESEYEFIWNILNGLPIERDTLTFTLQRR